MFSSKTPVALSDVSDNFQITEETLVTSRYEVLAKAALEKVAKCVDTITKTSVAIKITKDHPIFAEQAREEIDILKECLDPDECSVVRWARSFFHQRLICLQFELPDLSLRDYMSEGHFQALTVQGIRPVVHQLNTELLHLEALQIVHADLKPDNIMTVDRLQQQLRVKIIDFGLACHVVQNLWYRAPEVLLGSDITEPIDMWFFGVVTAKLAVRFFYGLLLYRS